MSKIEVVENMECKLHIWDTADFKMNSNIPLSLYDGVVVFIIVYDITRRVIFMGFFRRLMMLFLVLLIRLLIKGMLIGRFIWLGLMLIRQL